MLFRPARSRFPRIGAAARVRCAVRALVDERRYMLRRREAAASCLYRRAGAPVATQRSCASASAARAGQPASARTMRCGAAHGAQRATCASNARVRRKDRDDRRPDHAGDVQRARIRRDERGGGGDRGFPRREIVEVGRRQFPSRDLRLRIGAFAARRQQMKLADRQQGAYQVSTTASIAMPSRSHLSVICTVTRSSGAGSRSMTSGRSCAASRVGAASPTSGRPDEEHFALVRRRAVNRAVR